MSKKNLEKTILEIAGKDYSYLKKKLAEILIKGSKINLIKKRQKLKDLI